MTARAAAVKQHEIERAIRAAKKLGLVVTGVRPDGTVLTTPQEHMPPRPARQAGAKPRPLF